MILTPHEAVKLLRIRTAEIYRLLEDGEIPAFRVNNRWKIPKVLLERYVENRAETEALTRRKIAEPSKDLFSAMGIFSDEEE